MKMNEYNISITIINDSSALLVKSQDIQGIDNFPQGCAFSPDGLCVLTCTAADAKLRLYNNNNNINISYTNNNQSDDEDYDNKGSSSGNLPVEEHGGGNSNSQDTTTTTTTGHVVANDNQEADVVLEWKTALVCQGGNAVRSYAWYPHMKSSDPATCCFIATARYVCTLVYTRHSQITERWCFSNVAPPFL